MSKQSDCWKCEQFGGCADDTGEREGCIHKLAQKLNALWTSALASPGTLPCVPRVMLLSMKSALCKSTVAEMKCHDPHQQHALKTCSSFPTP